MTTEEQDMIEVENPAEFEASAFERFGFKPAILAALEALGFKEPTPIQSEAIPVFMSGKDVIGRARTGSGKTAAFGLPLLNQIPTKSKKPKGIILAPTRELALQVTDALNSFSRGSGRKITTIYGGASYTAQLKALKAGVSIVVGTPGRTLDLMNKGALDLSEITHFVLDEADEMLRMGFIEDVETLLEASGDEKQIGLFSATMPKPIRNIAESFMNDPIVVQVESKGMSTEHIEQKWIPSKESKKLPILQRIIEGWVDGAALVFVRTRMRCAQVADALTAKGIMADAIHGDLNQAARERVMSRLRNKAVKVLIATDVAARGIDVDHITHVINYDMPNDAENYVHRIGRTGRAGRAGQAISLIAPSDRSKVKRFQQKLKTQISETQPPSLKMINDARLKIWKTELLTRAETVPNVEEVVALSDEIMAIGDLTPEQLNTILLTALAQHKGIRFGIDAKHDPLVAKKKSSWKKDEKSDADFAAINETEVVLNIGKRDGARPSDIVWAIANHVDVPGNQIGRLKLIGKKTFVGLPNKVAEALLSTEEPMVIRGYDVHAFPGNPDFEPAPKPGRKRVRPRQNTFKKDAKASERPNRRKRSFGEKNRSWSKGPKRSTRPFRSSKKNR